MKTRLFAALVSLLSLAVSPAALAGELVQLSLLRVERDFELAALGVDVGEHDERDDEQDDADDHGGD